RNRAGLALHAAVGLDLRQREEIERLLLSRLEDDTLPLGHKMDLAQTAADWDGASASAANRIGRWITTALARTNDAPMLSLLATGLATVSARLDPETAAEAATALVKALEDSKGPRAQSAVPLTESLTALAPRLAAKDAVTTLA